MAPPTPYHSDRVKLQVGSRLARGVSAPRSKKKKDPRRKERKRRNMSGYKLYYFPVRAKGEIDRWAFSAAKIDFEDIRVNFGEEWRKEKECK